MQSNKRIKWYFEATLRLGWPQIKPGIGVLAAEKYTLSVFLWLELTEVENGVNDI